MACDPEPSVAFNSCCGILQDATWDTSDPSARIATYVVVVLIAELVVRLSICQVNPIDEPFSLHACDRAEDTGVVRAAK